jgi:hypothetical protein
MLHLQSLSLGFGQRFVVSHLSDDARNAGAKALTDLFGLNTNVFYCVV